MNVVQPQLKWLDRFITLELYGQKNGNMFKFFMAMLNCFSKLWINFRVDIIWYIFVLTWTNGSSECNISWVNPTSPAHHFPRAGPLRLRDLTDLTLRDLTDPTVRPMLGSFLFFSSSNSRKDTTIYYWSPGFLPLVLTLELWLVLEYVSW